MRGSWRTGDGGEERATAERELCGPAALRVDRDRIARAAALDDLDVLHRDQHTLERLASSVARRAELP